MDSKKINKDINKMENNDLIFKKVKKEDNKLVEIFDSIIKNSSDEKIHLVAERLRDDSDAIQACSDISNALEEGNEAYENILETLDKNCLLLIQDLKEVFPDEDMFKNTINCLSNDFKITYEEILEIVKTISNEIDDKNLTSYEQYKELKKSVNEIMTAGHDKVIICRANAKEAVERFRKHFDNFNK